MIFKKLIYELRFSRFKQGYEHGYSMYLDMRRKHPGKNERASLTPPPINKPWMFVHHTNSWLDGYSYGWSDANADWLTSFSVKDMLDRLSTTSFSEDEETLRIKFRELEVLTAHFIGERR